MTDVFETGKCGLPAVPKISPEPYIADCSLPPPPAPIADCQSSTATAGLPAPPVAPASSSLTINDLLGTRLCQVVCCGPRGCDLDPDYTDNRYWALLGTAGNSDGDPDTPIVFIPDVPDNIVTVTNYDEETDGTHNVYPGTIAPVLSAYDHSVPPVLRYFTPYMSQADTGQDCGTPTCCPNFNITVHDGGSNAIVYDFTLKSDGTYVAGVNGGSLVSAGGIWTFTSARPTVWTMAGDCPEAAGVFMNLSKFGAWTRVTETPDHIIAMTCDAPPPCCDNIQFQTTEGSEAGAITTYYDFTLSGEHTYTPAVAGTLVFDPVNIKWSFTQKDGTVWQATGNCPPLDATRWSTTDYVSEYDSVVAVTCNTVTPDQELDAMLTSPVTNEGGDSIGLYNFTSAVITSTTDPADGNIPQWRLLTSEEPGYVTGVAYYMNDPGFKYDPPSSFSPGNPVGYFPYDSSGGGVPGSIIARLRWDYDKATPPHKIYRILSVGCAQRYRIGHTDYRDNGIYVDRDSPNQGNGYRVASFGEESAWMGRLSSMVRPVPGGGSTVDGSYLAVGPATVALVNAVVGGATKLTGDNISIGTYSNAAAWLALGAGTGPTPSDAATVPTGIHASGDL